ncbi:MAG: T9SS type A sorting domain-containing protein [Bacteroidetes bacterium]|nr:T9SS type A sorting domain-containing protein [Bacteroidota bacterium]
MKTKITLLALMLVAFGFTNGQAWQVQNGGFETWTNPLAPDGWCTLESIFDPVAPGLIVGFSSKDTINPYSGTSSIRLSTDSVTTPSGKAVQGGLVSLGTGAYTGTGVTFTGISFPFRPDTLSFAYKYSTANIDTAFLNLSFKAGGASLINGAIILNDTTSTWSPSYVPLTNIYATSAVPTEMYIQFGSSIGTGGSKGSVFNVDGVSFGYVNVPTLVEEIKSNVTTSVYPNPSKNLVNVSVSELHSQAMIMVFDITGRVVKHQFMDGSTHQFNVSTWAEGLYSFSIIEEGKVITKGRFTVAK